MSLEMVTGRAGGRPARYLKWLLLQDPDEFSVLQGRVFSRKVPTMVMNLVGAGGGRLSGGSYSLNALNWSQSMM